MEGDRALRLQPAKGRGLTIFRRAGLIWAMQRRLLGQGDDICKNIINTL